MDITVLQGFSNRKLYLLLLRNGFKKETTSPVLKPWSDYDRNSAIIRLSKVVQL